MTPAAGLETPEVLAQLGAASAVACVYTFICHAFLPRRGFHGSPLYNWLSCLPIQLVGFPLVVSLAVGSFDGGAADWVAAPWSAMDGTWERAYLLLMWGYLFKDCALYAVGGGMDAMYWAHHVVCWATVFNFFYTDLCAIFLVGGSAMEFGGASQTLHLIFAESQLMDKVHVTTMTASHVVACGMAVYYLSLPAAPLAARLVFGTVVFGLSFERQKYAMKLHREAADRFAKRA
ncbi:hypothetical protein JL721_6048 [Aureococcus anophagefferens]|nr:hypothetical protein JL721_6048 [Aureococcus anophagefferens]